MSSTFPFSLLHFPSSCLPYSRCLLYRLAAMAGAILSVVDINFLRLCVGLDKRRARQGCGGAMFGHAG
jgi:hypothetical protein